MDVDTESLTINETSHDVETGGVASTSTPSSDFVQNWLNHVHHNDQETGSSTINLLSEEQLAELTMRNS